MSHAAELAGCRPPWESWASPSINTCNNITYQKYFSTVWELFDSELRMITNRTGCKEPCKYREYEFVGEPVGWPGCTEG